jgi:hypothetical protein
MSFSFEFIMSNPTKPSIDEIVKQQGMGDYVLHFHIEPDPSGKGTRIGKIILIKNGEIVDNLISINILAVSDTAKPITVDTRFIFG